MIVPGKKKKKKVLSVNFAVLFFLYTLPFGS